MTIELNFSSVPQNINTELLNDFNKIISNQSTQFFYTFDNQDYLTSSKKMYEKFKSKKTFVHVGIGGSSLGPEMMVYALQKNSTQFIFVNNIDPEEIYSQLKNISFDDSVFYFVSKSGGTAETMAALAIISTMLFDKGIKKEDLNKYFVFATDPVKSELLTLGKELNIDCLQVPSNVGGRFCALTPVGFLPALFAGINIDLLVAGATKTRNELLENKTSNKLLTACEFLFDLKNKNGIDQTVFMPYSSKLKYLAFWFTQLWAESLGKKQDLNGNIVHTGFTPITAYGATDQHSQMQLFMEGPKDKALIIIEVLNFAHDFSLSTKISSNNLEKLSSFKLSDLIKAELHGTLKALKEADRPYIHLTIDKNDEEHLGGLIIFFESLTALMGHYLKIDPFNQPGVELGKIYAFEFLSRLK